MAAWKNFLSGSTIPPLRAKIKTEMAADHPTWENLYFDSGGGAA